MNGLQSKVAVVGRAPRRTYRSASPVPPEVWKTTCVWPAGTVSFQNCCEPEAPEMLVTGTLLPSGVVVSAANVARSVTPEYAAKPLSMMNQLPAAGLVKEQVSLFPLRKGLQSKVAVVGCEPKRT